MPVWDERRAESRYPTDNIVEVWIMLDPNSSQQAKVLNVSRSGLRLELRRALPVGTAVEVITPLKLRVLGVIRYCRQSGEVFHAGVRIQMTIMGSVSGAEHLDDNQMSAYAARQGLSMPDFFRLQKHLETCESCRSRLAELLK